MSSFINHFTREMRREWKNEEQEQKSTVYAFQVSGE